MELQPQVNWSPEFPPHVQAQLLFVSEDISVTGAWANIIQLINNVHIADNDVLINALLAYCS